MWGLFISWATLKPASHSSFDVPAWAADLHLDKWVHFGLWFIWTWLFFKNVKPGRKLMTVSVIFFSAYGGFIEYLQGYMNAGRTADFWDWMADSMGVFAIFLYSAVYQTKKGSL